MIINFWQGKTLKNFNEFIFPHDIKKLKKVIKFDNLFT